MPPDANRVVAWQHQNAAIRRAFDPVTREPFPFVPSKSAADAIPVGAVDRTPRIETVRNARRRRRLAATVGAFASGACVALLGAVAVGRLGMLPERVSILEVAPFAPLTQTRHARVSWRTFAHDSDAFASEHPTSQSPLHRATALSKAPDLSAEDFAPIGQRLMPGIAEPAAFLLYKSPDHVCVAVIIERTSEGDGPAVADDKAGLRSLVWRSGGYAVSVVGPMDADGFRAVARRVAAALAGPQL